MSKRQAGHLGRVIAEIWPAAHGRLDLLHRAIDAFFDDREAFTIDQGHSIAEFQRRSDHWLRKALGTAPSPAARGRLAESDAASERYLRGLAPNGGLAGDHARAAESPNGGGS
jgi:hypothetical protein